MKILNQTPTERFLLLVYHVIKLKDLELEIIRLDQVLNVVSNFCHEKKEEKKGGRLNYKSNDFASSERYILTKNSSYLIVTNWVIGSITR